MSHLTPLESAVMDAMVWQMGDSVPDLATQAASSSPGLRRNTGAGLYSRIVVDADRATRNPDATGLFGTVHVMVGDLPDPIGFQIELRQGRLIALHGQSYGQDTRAIDFSSTPFGEVFTVDARGQSVLYRPARRAPDPVAPRPKPAARPAPQAQTPTRLPVSAAKPADPAPAPAAAPNLTEILASASNPTASRAGKLALVYLGAYALAVLFVLFAQFVLHLGWIFAAIVAAWALRYIHNPKGRVMMSDIADSLDRNGVFQALKPN
ncbi:hypothetical protein EGY25_02410 [Brevundimonas intermedia]|uniref:Uncharacterized protein n=1 Tax=Brevundimonas intermedia TaxID=74315 RepID=A0A4Y9S0S2_9CAUL|nr:hypothetical protein [Brevundimonas intermedia]TFW14081.1 hypothetical protein EGY25_02410 [Brevundimonas intermedia]